MDHVRREIRSERKLAIAYEAERIRALPTWDSGRRDEILAALHRLAPAQRAVLLLRYADGLSVPEVARAIGRSVHATESLLARARQRFRDVFDEVER